MPDTVIRGHAPRTTDRARPAARTTDRARPAALPSRLPSLTGLRWIAAATIFGYHVMLESGFFADKQARGVLEVLFSGGRSAVSFFYVLSGFVLTWSAGSTVAKTGFWRRRFARIYPSHFVTFLAAAAYLSWAGRDLDPQQAIANLTLTQSWPDDRTYWWSYNGVSWSLSVEFFFYLTFPFLLPFLSRLRPAWWWATAAACVAGVICLPVVATWRSEPTVGGDAFYAVYQFPPARLLEFVLGMVLALLVRDGRWRGPGIVCSTAVWVAGLLLTREIVRVTDEPLLACAATGIVGCALLIPAAARADAEGSVSVFRTPRLVRMGEVSFAFYLVHELVLSPPSPCSAATPGSRRHRRWHSPRPASALPWCSRSCCTTTWRSRVCGC
ncbi:acyltransferase family protein [Streptomyces sp. P1-3]|uniref:acyltransferase family protein n=1 Tax=Streptomyces sp. P1-3 TaxID=3421658 RepID=UPI003D36D929